MINKTLKYSFFLCLLWIFLLHSKQLSSSGYRINIKLTVNTLPTNCQISNLNLRAAYAGVLGNYIQSNTSEFILMNNVIFENLSSEQTLTITNQSSTQCLTSEDFFIQVIEFNENLDCFFYSDTRDFGQMNYTVEVWGEKTEPLPPIRLLGDSLNFGCQSTFTFETDRRVSWEISTTGSNYEPISGFPTYSTHLTREALVHSLFSGNKDFPLTIISVRYRIPGCPNRISNVKSFTFQSLGWEYDSIVFENQKCHDDDFSLKISGIKDVFFSTLQIDAYEVGADTPFEVETYEVNANEDQWNIPLRNITKPLIDVKPASIFFRLTGKKITEKDTTDYCMVETPSFSVEYKDSLEITDVTVFTESGCENSNDYEIQLFISGGTEPYEIEVTPGNPSINGDLITGLGTGTYTIHVTDANGCEYSKDVEIKPKDQLGYTLNFDEEDISAVEGDTLSLNSNCPADALVEMMLKVNIIDDDDEDAFNLNDYNTVKYHVNGETKTGDIENGIFEFEVSQGSTGWVLPRNTLCGQDLDEKIFFEVIPSSESVTFESIELIPPTCWNGPDAQAAIILSSENYTVSSIINGNNYFWAYEGNNKFIRNDLSPGPDTLHLINDEKGCVIERIIDIPNKARIRIDNNPIYHSTCSDESMDATFSWHNGKPNFSITLFDGSDPVFDVNNHESRNITIENLDPTKEYQLRIIDADACERSGQLGPALLPFSILYFETPDDQHYESNELEYHIACKGDSIPIHFDIQGGTSPAIFQVYEAFNTKDGEVAYDSIRSLIINGLAPDDSETIVISDWTAGAYKILAEDANGCPLTGPFYFSINEVEEALSLDSVHLVSKIGNYHLTCYGDNNGEANIWIQGGLPPYKVYKIADGVTLPNFDEFSNNDGGPMEIDNLEGQGIQYRLLVEDALGCEVLSELFELDEPDPITLALESFADELNGFEIPCFGDLGSLQVMVNGGISPYTLELFHRQATSADWEAGSIQSFQSIQPGLDTIFTNLDSGDYYIRVTDLVENCFFNSDTLSFRSPQPLSLSYEIVKKTTCPDSEDGIVEFSVSGGVPQGNLYEFVIIEEGDTILSGSLDSTFIFDSANALYYEFILSDANACQVSESFIMETLETPVTLQSNGFNPPHCEGGSTGELFLKASDGYPPYDYFLMVDGEEQAVIGNADEVVTFTDLFAGLYSFRITDDEGCSYEGEVEVFERTDPLRIDEVQFIDPTCPNFPDAQMRVFPTGGDRPYQISMNGEDWYDLEDDLDNPSHLFQGLRSGETYPLYLRDQNWTLEQDFACTYDSLMFFPRGDSISVNFEIEHLSCFGSNDGLVRVVPRFGNDIDLENFIVEWLDPETGEVNFQGFEKQNLAPGEVQVRVQYLYQPCQPIFATNVLGPAQPLSISSIQTAGSRCHAPYSGSIIVNVSGGWPNQNYLYTLNDWEDDQMIQLDENSQFILNQLAPGVQELKIASLGFSCEAAAEFEIGYQLYDISLVSVLPTSCDGSEDGEVVLTSQYAQAVFELWKDEELVSTNVFGVFDGLAAGSYSGYVSDASGSNCRSNPIPIDIDTPEPISFQLEEILQPGCEAMNGGIKGEVFGGIPPYQISWLDANLQEVNPEALSAGTYYLEVRDSIERCYFLETFQLEEEEAFELSLDSLKLENCDKLDGEIRLKIEGGQAPFQFDWEGYPENNQPILTSISAGNYQVRVRDALGCEQELSIDLPKEDPIGMEVVHTQKSQCSIPNGWAELAITGGIAPYHFTWDERIAEIEGTRAFGLKGHTIYWVNVRDQKGCEELFYFSVGDEEGPVFSWEEVEKPSCGLANGSIEVLDFSWEDTHLLLDEDTLYDPLIQGLEEGRNYWLRAIDSLGCTHLEPIFFDPDPLGFPMVNSISQSSSCHMADGSIELDVGGGFPPYTVLWDHGAEGLQIEQLPPGFYTYTLIDARQCSLTASVEVMEKEAPLIQFVGRESSLCGEADGYLEVTAIGGEEPFEFVWSHDPNLTDSRAENLMPGWYTIQVKDQNQCLSESIQLEVPSLQSDLQISISDIRPASCPTGADGSIEILVSGGQAPYDILWNDPLQQAGESAEGLASGNHSVLVTDALGCTQSRTYFVGALQALQIEDVVMVEPSCLDTADGQISLALSGGSGNYEVVWSQGSTELLVSGLTANGLTAGNYQVRISDGDCVLESQIQLEAPNALQLHSMEMNIPTCPGDSDGWILLDIGGGTAPYTVTWDHGPQGPFLNNSPAGTYTYNVSDLEGCSISGEVELPDANEISISIENNSLPSCPGAADGRIELEVLNARNPLVRWSDGAIGRIRNNLTSGTYEVEINDADGCQNTFFVTLEDPQTIQVEAQINHPACNGSATGSLELSISGGNENYLVVWEGGGNQMQRNNLPAGRYPLRVSDGLGCEWQGEFVLEDPPLLSIEQLEWTEPTCFGAADGSIQVQVSGGVEPYKYFWDDEPGTFEKLDVRARRFQIRVEDAVGCEVRTQLDLPQPLPLSVLESTIVHPLCNCSTDGQLSVLLGGGSGEYQVSWSNGATGQSIDQLSAGLYTVNISDQQGCSMQRNFVLSNPPRLNVSASTFADPVCHAEPNGSADLIVHGGTPPYQYLWNDGIEEGSRLDLFAGSYAPTIVDANGCEISFSFELEDPDPIYITGLPDHVVVCQGGVRYFDAGSEWVAYSWEADNGFTSTDREVAISQDGTYTLTTYTDLGCTDEHTLIYEKDPNLLEDDFLVTEHVYEGDTISLIELGWPIPDSIAWEVVSDGLFFIYREEGALLQVIFVDKGEYKVNLTSYLDDCVNHTQKTLVVKDDSERPDDLPWDQHSEDIVLNVYPNPTHGDFNVLVELLEKSSIHLEISNMDFTRKYFVFDGENDDQFLIPYRLENVPSGIYLIKVESPLGTRIGRLIIN